MPTTHPRILLAAAATGVLLLASACGSNGDSTASGKAALVEQVMEEYFDDAPNADCLRNALGKLSDADLRELSGPLADAESLALDQEAGPAAGPQDPPQITAITDQCEGSEAPVDMVPAAPQ